MECQREGQEEDELMSSANISAGPLKCLRGEQTDPNQAAHSRKILQPGLCLLNFKKEIEHGRLMVEQLEDGKLNGPF